MVYIIFLVGLTVVCIHGGVLPFPALSSGIVLDFLLIRCIMLCLHLRECILCFVFTGVSFYALIAFTGVCFMLCLHSWECILWFDFIHGGVFLLFVHLVLFLFYILFTNSSYRL